MRWFGFAVAFLAFGSGCSGTERAAGSPAGGPEGQPGASPASQELPKPRSTDLLSRPEFQALRQLESVSPAEPALGVSAIRPLGPGLVQVERGGRVALSALAEPGASVVFRTVDGGRFDGGSTLVEVKADGTGLATATFWATPDATGYVDVEAFASSMSGRATFAVQVAR